MRFGTVRSRPQDGKIPEKYNSKTATMYRAEIQVRTAVSEHSCISTHSGALSASPLCPKLYGAALVALMYPPSRHTHCMRHCVSSFTCLHMLPVCPLTVQSPHAQPDAVRAARYRRRPPQERQGLHGQWRRGARRELREGVKAGGGRRRVGVGDGREERRQRWRRRRRQPVLAHSRGAFRVRGTQGPRPPGSQGSEGYPRFLRAAGDIRGKQPRPRWQPHPRWPSALYCCPVCAQYLSGVRLTFGAAARQRRIEALARRRFARRPCRCSVLRPAAPFGAVPRAPIRRTIASKQLVA
jgi:hypothetical protein